MNTNTPALTGSSLHDQLCSVTGTEYVRPAGPEDAVLGVSAQWVVSPGSEQEVASLLRMANDAGLAVLPRGGGTKIGWGNPPQRADVILSMQRLNQVIEHTWGDLTVSVEAGCTFGALERKLAEHGQRLALDPLWPDEATIGGILSSNDTGVLRLYYGGLRDLLIGITLALPDGTLARSGGKVVENVAGYDLPKLAIGALGTLGVITRAIFRVHPVPAGVRTLSIQAENASQTQRVIQELLHSNVSHGAIQARIDSRGLPVIDAGLQGSEAGLAAQELRIRELVYPLAVSRAAEDVWRARQEIWLPQDGAAIAKICVLPSQIEETLAAITRLAGKQRAAWRFVLQATGIGWLRLEAAEQDSLVLLETLRREIEAAGGSQIELADGAQIKSAGGSQIEIAGGSLVVLRRPSPTAGIDAWGSVGDALPLMVALKQQFDPQRTLNPCRYAGGI